MDLHITMPLNIIYTDAGLGKIRARILVVSTWVIYLYVFILECFEGLIIKILKFPHKM